MSTMYSRRAGRIVPRRVGDTEWHDPSPHAQTWRAVNDGPDAEADDIPRRVEPMTFVDRVIVAVAFGASVGLVVWSIELAVR